jgi:hypothetical protein
MESVLDTMESILYITREGGIHMAETTSEPANGAGSACGAARFFIGTRRQVSNDALLMIVAALAPAFLAVALRRQWPMRTAVWLAVAAVVAIGLLFLRQVVRGERGWMFYTGMLLFGVLPGRGDALLKAGAAPAWTAGMALVAVASAVVGIVGAVRLVQALDEMWRQINYRALAFAFITTLSAVLVQWLLANFGIEVLTWRVLLLLMAALWGVGMIWAYRRLR